MKLLLDTHAFLWFLAGSEQLSDRAREAMADRHHELLLSTASLWEMAIKHSLGKLTLARPFDELIPEQLSLLEIQTCSIELRHLSRLITLPMRHRDPFDRLIIAQSLADDLMVVTKDHHFGAYEGLSIIW